MVSQTGVETPPTVSHRDKLLEKKPTNNDSYGMDKDTDSPGRPPTLLDEPDDESKDDLIEKRLVLDERTIDRISRHWLCSVIFTVMGRTVNTNYLSSRLQLTWNLTGEMAILDIGHGYFITKFETNEDYLRLLTESPWVVMDHYIVVYKWQSNFQAENADIHTAPVWIRLQDISMECYDEPIFHRIGNLICKYIRSDRTTMLAEKGRFAPICVEVDLKMPLTTKVTIVGRTSKVLEGGIRKPPYGLLHMRQIRPPA
ncbi:hypothetical protein Scep_017534 [Stephania cephalantha]|uniref:DUF4283 domain-containing protein n=1 Tax=Stephania cephalantha TaxID=152367 RepID=A0AAP0NX12_9MAGN